MIAALIDNGSLQPAAHRQLRRLAAALSVRSGIRVDPVSWKYSDKIPPAVLEDRPAWTLSPWFHAQYAAGERRFVFVPCFVSPQGAIGSRLQRDVERLQRAVGPCEIVFTPGLGDAGGLAAIVASRVQETTAIAPLRRPIVVVVDHGGPSAASAALRDEIAAAVRARLGREVRAVMAASLGGERHRHNRPAYAKVFNAPACRDGDLVIAPLFLAPGRHAGPEGDLVRIANAAVKRHPGLTCHFTEPLGTHPLIVDLLAEGLRRTIAP